MKRTNLEMFWTSLKHHPGLEFVIFFSGLFSYVGYSTAILHPWKGAVTGLLFSLLFWVPVLITAWTRRRHHEG